MSFHVKDDFKSGLPFSQIPVEWFNSVAKFLNGLVGGFGIETKKNQKGLSTISLKKGVLNEEIENAIKNIRVSKDVGTPVDKTDSPSVLDTNGDAWIWKAGGANGLEMDCYCKLGPQQSGSTYSVFQRVRMTISKDGLVVKAELKSDRIRLRAQNG